MRLVELLVLYLFLQITFAQTTLKKNSVLSRKKRFLVFPENSNFVMTISGLKEILLKVPKGFRTLVECDVFFKLPNASYRSYLKKLSMHSRHRRHVYDQISRAIDVTGFDGDSCIKKMICEAQYLEPFRENSLFKQLLFAIFVNPSSQNETIEYCRKDYNMRCDISLLGIILNHIYNKN